MVWFSVNFSVFFFIDIEIKRIRKFFQSSSYDLNRVVVLFGGYNVDFKFFLILIGEYYIDNFVINYFLKKMFFFKSK